MYPQLPPQIVSAFFTALMLVGTAVLGILTFIEFKMIERSIVRKLGVIILAILTVTSAIVMVIFFLQAVGAIPLLLK